MATNDIENFKAAHARFLAAIEKGEHPGHPDFHWFTHKRWQAITESIAAHADEVERVEVWNGLSGKGKPELWVVARDRRGEIIMAENVSHPCPPDCGEG